MMRSSLVILTLLWLSTGLRSPVAAQDSPRLLMMNASISLMPDGFGGEAPLLRGQLYNHGDSAYTNISIFAEALDADGRLIGEGFGYLVDACGTALLDFTLAPGAYQAFSAPLELFAAGEAEDITLSVDAQASAYQQPAQRDLPAVERIAEGEAVMLEWLDERTLIYGIGCADSVFTELEWQRYSFGDGGRSQIAHPDAARVTPEMLELADVTLVSQSGERNPDLYFRSHLTYSPSARRVVYQNDLHSIYSAEPDGSYRRLIHRNLHRHSLRGFVWALNPGVFLAYHFGSYGEPVYYFTAHVDGQMLSGWLESLPPSLIVPGPAPDGYAVVVGRRDGDIKGYYWQGLYGDAQLLFAADLPGNNYPAPVVTRDEIYIARPPEDEGSLPTLQCFSRRTRELSTVTALPMQIRRDARAWAWLSPGGAKLALGMNGAHGGLWLVDVAGGCG